MMCLITGTLLPGVCSGFSSFSVWRHLVVSEEPSTVPGKDDAEAHVGGASAAADTPDGGKILFSTANVQLLSSFWSIL